jgi:hypothetical protein
MNEKIAKVTEHLLNLATKGEQTSIGIIELLQKWADGEVSANAVINILLQNNAMADAQVAAIAFTLGITAKEKQEAAATEGYVFSDGQPMRLLQETLIDFIDDEKEKFFGIRVCDVPDWKKVVEYKISEGEKNGN